MIKFIKNLIVVFNIYNIKICEPINLLNNQFILEKNHKNDIINTNEYDENFNNYNEVLMPQKKINFLYKIINNDLLKLIILFFTICNFIYKDIKGKIFINNPKNDDHQIEPPVNHIPLAENQNNNNDIHNIINLIRKKIIEENPQDTLIKIIKYDAIVVQKFYIGNNVDETFLNKTYSIEKIKQEFQEGFRINQSLLKPDSLKNFYWILKQNDKFFQLVNIDHTKTFYTMNNITIEIMERLLNNDLKDFFEIIY